MDPRQAEKAGDDGDALVQVKARANQRLHGLIREDDQGDDPHEECATNGCHVSS